MAHNVSHGLCARLTLLIVCLAPLTACDAGGSAYGPGGSSGLQATAAPCPGNACTPGAGARTGQMFVEPGGGGVPVWRAFRGGEQSGVGGAGFVVV